MLRYIHPWPYLAQALHRVTYKYLTLVVSSTRESIKTKAPHINYHGLLHSFAPDVESTLDPIAA